MKNYVIITIGIMALAFILPNGYAQNETRTSEDCMIINKLKDNIEKKKSLLQDRFEKLRERMEGAILDDSIPKDEVNSSSNCQTNQTDLSSQVMKLTKEQEMDLSNSAANASASYTNDTGLDPNSDLGMDTGTGYYPPPYSYNECLSVSSKESCDFRFNR